MPFKKHLIMLILLIEILINFSHAMMQSLVIEHRVCRIQYSKGWITEQ